MNLAKFIGLTLWLSGTASAVSYIAYNKVPINTISGLPIHLVAVVGSAMWVVLFVVLMLNEIDD